MYCTTVMRPLNTACFGVAVPAGGQPRKTQRHITKATRRSGQFFSCGLKMRVILAVLATIVLQSSNVRGRALRARITQNQAEELQSAQFWRDDAQLTLEAKLLQSNNKRIARNVIFFLGDGMSVTTVTAARIYDGQQKQVVGERHRLSFERFPYVGLSKTYCVNAQIADSACTSTAYLCGVKANRRTIGVAPSVTLNDCEAANQPENQLHSIAAWALDAHKSAGIVTTTRVTHASPAGAYAHTPNREFECDADVQKAKQDPRVCQDIALQLLENDVSKRFSVILGGGRDKFLPERNGSGERKDGRNLLTEWLNSKPQSNAQVVSTRAELLKVDSEKTDYLLGLFAANHMRYNLDNMNGRQPSLAEMTEAAIKMLRKNAEGYFLFVEGGRIDHGHHDTRARKALDETAQFAEAVQRAYELTNDNDTLIVVTADHGHTMSMSGYSDLNNDIDGLSSDKAEDGLPYTTLMYANGPAFRDFYRATWNGEVRRTNLNLFYNLNSTNFEYPTGVPLKDESHDGSDVAIYANGPWSHLFSGVIEQNALPTFMGYAACIGPGRHVCSDSEEPPPMK